MHKQIKFMDFEKDKPELNQYSPDEADISYKGQKQPYHMLLHSQVHEPENALILH